MVKLRIEGEGPTASGYRVFLDDEEISSSTRAVTFNSNVDDANTATLEVYVDKLEISADVEARLECIHIGRERTTFASRLREWLR